MAFYQCVKVGGGSANIVNCTQAEYDALPSSKESDDVMLLSEFIEKLKLAHDVPNYYNINSQVEYDNTDSGLTSDDVQGAIDELSERPTLPSVDVQTAVDEFETYNGGLLSSLKVSLTPNQDLHGYDSPWVGGSRKNKLPMTLANIIALNTDGTWSGNTYTFRGIDYTVLVDDANNIIGFDTNGTASERGWFFIAEHDFGETDVAFNNVTVNGYIFTAGNSAYIANQQMIYYNHASKRTYFIMDGITTNHEKWYPMVRLSSESDPTFEPYSNICPISGHTEVDLDVKDGDNVTQHTNQVQIGSTVYGGSLDIVSGSGEDAYTNIASYNGETINEPWISSMDVYTEGGTPTTGAQVVYPKTTATAISTTPQQIETLVGENHLSTPLGGQEITESKYKQMFTFDDVIAYIQSLS